MADIAHVSRLYPHLTDKSAIESCTIYYQDMTRLLSMFILLVALCAMGASTASATQSIDPNTGQKCVPGNAYGLEKQGDSAKNAKCTAPVPPPVVDVCSNIDGAQAVVPEGMVANGDGTCSLPAPPDPCGSSLDRNIVLSSIAAGPAPGQLIINGQCLDNIRTIAVQTTTWFYLYDNPNLAPGATTPASSIGTKTVADASTMTDSVFSITDDVMSGQTVTMIVVYDAGGNGLIVQNFDPTTLN